jgi:hypothetical protein
MKKILFILLCVFHVITFSENAPYNVNKKKFPLGENFRKLLPEKIGDWESFAFHDFIPKQEEGAVYYQKGKKEIYVNFGKAWDQNDMKVIWDRMFRESTEGKEGQLKQKNMTNPSTKYFLLEGPKFQYTWTRNLYYFSITTKDKADADDFMKSFPW